MGVDLKISRSRWKLFVGAMARILYLKVVKVEIMSMLERFGLSGMVMELYCSYPGEKTSGGGDARGRRSEVEDGMWVGEQRREPSMCKGQTHEHTWWF